MIPISEWGKDHWSTFAYIETRIVDYRGEPDREQMRCDPKIHPHYANTANRSFPDSRYPTLLKTRGVWSHDDWSCLEDAVEAGLLIEKGTGLNPIYALTDYGKVVISKLREWKAAGNNFKDFTL